MPDYHQAFNNMGNAFSAKGDKDKAIECYQKAIDIKPDKHEAFKHIFLPKATRTKPSNAIKSH
ncbi:MAG: tetratricopeptide repeat protein [Haliscomenobacter sp.]|nr:tetratricopeptide repeat protein [Haliscomenobacter sp.]